MSLWFGDAAAQPASCGVGGATITTDCTNGNAVSYSGTNGTPVYAVTNTTTFTNRNSIDLTGSNLSLDNGDSTILILGRVILNNSGTVSNSATFGGTSSARGMAINIAGGSLTLNNSGTVSTASALGISSSAPYGAAIYLSPVATSATINNLVGGTISGANYGVALNTGSAGTSSIINRGTISGGISGVVISGAGGVTLGNYGTISGGTNGSAVSMTAGGNTININNGAVFTNGIDYGTTTGNTTNFYTGSYTLGVKQYSVTGNTINARGAATQVITSGLDTNGTGNIVVANAQVVIAAPSGASNVTSGASTVVNAVVNTPVVTPTVPALSGFTPEAPAPGIGGPGFQPASLALDPTFAERLQEAFPETKLTNLNQTADLGMTRVKQGQTIDVNGNLVWVRGFGATRNLPSTATVVGNGNTSIGMLFGYDRQFEDWRIGAYAGYAYGYTRMLDASGTLGSDYYVAGLYGRRSFGAYTVTANLSGGVMGNRSSRSINNDAEQAIGSFGGFFIAPELALSYDMALGDNMTLTPTLRGRYVGAFLPGYTESGSSQNVTYGANSAHALEERLELKLTKAFRGEKGLTSSIYVQVAALANQRIGADGFNASVLGTDFTVSNPYSRSTVGGLVGVGVEHQFDRQITGFAGADAALYSDSTLSFTGRAGLKVSF